MKSEQKYIASNKIPAQSLTVSGSNYREKAAICLYLVYRSRLKDEENRKSELSFPFGIEFSSIMFLKESESESATRELAP